MNPNAFHRLKMQAEAESTKTYKARGILVKRCPKCQINPDFCICNLSPNLQSDVDFILIYHRDEIFKPSNTGRLIADTFPENTYAFCWDRKNPDISLISLLEEPGRDFYIVFPAEDSETRDVVETPKPSKNKTLTLILLDATWRQGRRMFNFSQWLKHIPALRLLPAESADYTGRKAHQEDYLSTAESAASALDVFERPDLSAPLLEYFRAFNQRYLAMRSNHKPKKSELNMFKNKNSIDS